MSTNADKTRTLLKRITDRMAIELLPITAPDKMRASIDRMAVVQWREQEDEIGYDTGRLHAMLTEDEHEGRTTRLVGGSTIEIDIAHNGAVYRREEVLPELDGKRLAREAADDVRRRR